MTIQINPLNASALAALAGNHIGALGLPVANWGAYGENYANMVLQNAQLQEQYKGLLTQKQIAQAHDQTVLQDSQYRAQAQMAQQQNQQQFQGQQNDLDRLIEQKKFEQQQQYNQGMLGYRQQELEQQGKYQQGELYNQAAGQDIEQQRVDQLNDFHNQLIQQRKAQIDLLAQSKLDDKDKQKIGAASTMVLTWMNSHDPSAWAQGLPPILKAYHDEGILSDDDYNKYSQLPPQAIHDIAAHQLLSIEKADEISKDPILQQSLQYAIKGQNKMSQAAQSKAEDNAMSMMQQKQQSGSLVDTINKYPEAFTTANKYAAEGRTLEQRIPILAPIIDSIAQLAGVDPAKAEEARTAVKSQTAATWALYAKSISPRLASAMNAAIKGDMMPDVDKDGIDGARRKAQNLDNLFKGMDALNQQFMKNGVISNKPAYEEAVQKLFIVAQNQAQAGGASASSSESQSYTFNGRRVKAEAVDQIMAMNPGMTREQVIQNLQGK